MPALRETQAAFRAALLGGDPAAAAATIAGDGLAPAARLAIYRHHVQQTLADALAATYPVVRRLVDPRFFAWAAHEYVVAHPPAGPCLFEYGETFPEFLAGFEPCRALVYLPDVARLEWALNRAYHAPDAVPLDAGALRGIAPARLDDVALTLHPSLAVLASPWPIARIWTVNRVEDPTEVVALDEGGVRLEIRRDTDDDAVVRSLDAGACALERALLDGRPLGAAAEAALAADAAFDLAAALRRLFAEGSVVGVGLPAPAR